MLNETADNQGNANALIRAGMFLLSVDQLHARTYVSGLVSEPHDTCNQGCSAMVVSS